MKEAEAKEPVFTILVGDNYHYGDEEYEHHAGRYHTWGKAVARCKQIVDDSLTHLHEPGMSSDRLWSQYVMFGEDPFIVPTVGERFSAWEYARGRCREIYEEPCPPGR